ncbi:hypothetical protein PHISCL_06941 [Aspergillus sclerotialis]|uniref:Uncharacterized protein n=1 Tax=Aspergillus sclerotialis TaxID=2070753 RepID=A0A3A2ZDN3_9EURO|nr:hypothetical protein PHISCL_06941 [Aspergillus sclerotialis]
MGNTKQDTVDGPKPVIKLAIRQSKPINVSSKAPAVAEQPERRFDIFERSEWDPPDYSKFPWNYDMKWPVTRAERIKELDDLFAHYKHTYHKDNVIAVKAWHSQFPPDQIVPRDGC